MYNIKLAFRNIRRNGLYSVINIVGLAVSLTVCILIMLWVKDEMSYDNFHKKGRDIYQTIVTFNMNNQDLYWKASSFPLAPRSMEEIPGIRNFCRIERGGDVKFRHNDNESPALPLTFADTSFFSMFSFEIVDGDARNPFPDKQAIVVSEEAARALFGDEEAIGKIIETNGLGTLHVTAVMKDMPRNTDFTTDFFCSMDLLYDLQGGKEVADQRWGALGILTFFLLEPGADVKKIAEEITVMNNRYLQENPMTYYLQPLTQNHFYNEKGEPNSNLQTARLFTVAVFVLLIIACINYVNLVTARVSKRNREILLRGILGAKKRNLFFQSIMESFLLFLIAMAAATVLLYAVFPLFKELSGKQMELRLLSWEMSAIYLIVLVAVTLVAGIFPAFNLAFRNPAEMLGRSSGKSAKGVLVRQVLVVVQFVAAVMLIMGATTIGRQMKFIRQKDLGYNKEHILSFRFSKNMMGHEAAIKSELERQTSILGVTFSSQNILWAGTAAGWFSPEDPNKNLMLGFISTDKDFIPTMQMELLEGENFTGSPTDSAYFILNETAVRATGIEDPVGKPFIFQPNSFSNYENGKIIGVVKDFHFKDLHIPIEPMVLCYQGDPRMVYIRVGAAAAQEAVEAIENMWKRYNPKESLRYAFLDDTFDSFYRADIRVNKLFIVFAIVAIFISCLGLFGLVTFMAETKTKEIGIRKVLGASVADIVKMLSKEFLILVGISMLVAFPLAYYWLNRMLQDYAYRISISWTLFLWTALITLAVTLLTVCLQAVRAATEDPVKAIETS